VICALFSCAANPALYPCQIQASSRVMKEKKEKKYKKNIACE
jgi:hypothetical protein